jgi:hypothetical protein
MSRKPDLGLAIWCRLPCFPLSPLRQLRTDVPGIIWGLALLFTSGRTTPAGSLRQSAAEIPRSQGFKASSPLGGLYWNIWTYKQRFGSRVVKCPNPKWQNMQNDWISFQAWWHEYQFVALTRPRGGRMPRSDWANRSIYRSGIYPLNFDRIAPMGCTTS